MYNKSGFSMTTCDDQFSVLTERKLQSTFQSQTCMRKRSWSLFGGLVPVWPTVAFWIPAKPLHLRSMLSKSMRCTANCKTCHWHSSTERAQLFTTKPDRTLHNQASQGEELGYCILSLLPYSPDHSPSDNHLFKHLHNFLKGKWVHNQQEAEHVFQECLNPEAHIFML